MITYFIVICCVLYFSYLAERNHNVCVEENCILPSQRTKDTKIFLFIIIAVLTVTAGCRYHVGTDYGNYIDIYETQYIKWKWENFFEFDEPILPLIGKLSYLWFDSYYPMFFTASVTTVGFMLYSTYKETTDFIFVTMLYVFAGGWTGSFNGIRQYIAIAIAFLGRKYILQRKFWKFLLVCLVAFLAHKSALFFILVYFIYSEEFTTVRLICITIITIIVSRSYEVMFDLIGWINDKEFIVNDYALKSVNTLRILAGCAPAIVAVYYAYNKKLDKEQVFYAYMLVANATVWLVTADSAYLARLALYTGVFVPLGLSSILKSTIQKYKLPIKIGVMVLYMLFWLYDVSNSKTLREFEWIFSYL